MLATVMHFGFCQPHRTSLLDYRIEGALIHISHPVILLGMRYDVEDEIDWSDGSLEPRSPPPNELIRIASPVEQALEERGRSLSPFEDEFQEQKPHEQWQLPFGEHLPLSMS
jgi:hypothetical protein